jgi:hypothetical protein
MIVLGVIFSIMIGGGMVVSADPTTFEITTADTEPDDTINVPNRTADVARRVIVKIVSI